MLVSVYACNTSIQMCLDVTGKTSSWLCSRKGSRSDVLMIITCSSGVCACGQPRRYQDVASSFNL